ncbi:MAG: hypothetical protein LBC40_00475, partial [Dysgonamonadaceae bacterium]|nr:hypothetical protein [Dysgonamonadaceae bacterium]
MKTSKNVFLAGLMTAICSISLASCGSDTGEPAPGNGENTGADAKAIYAAPDGKTNATGAIDSPVDIYTAVTKIEAGGTIYLRGGVYYLTKGLDLNKIG